MTILTRELLEEMKLGAINGQQIYLNLCDLALKGLETEKLTCDRDALLKSLKEMIKLFTALVEVKTNDDPWLHGKPSSLQRAETAIAAVEK